MNHFIDTVIHKSEINLIKRDKAHLIDLVEHNLRSELPINCTYAELIRKAQMLDFNYRASFKMSRHEFKLFKEATISTLREKQFDQFNLSLN